MRRRTRQRRTIAQVLAGAPGPLTPREVLEQAGRVLPGLGVATVYRNLAVLEEEGEIRSVHLPGEHARYESTGRGHHHHFRCRSCAMVFDLDARCPVAVLEGATLPGGFRVNGHDLTLYGTCPDCAERDEATGSRATGA